MRKTDAKIVGVSPIVDGAPIKGPADKLMRGLGFEVSAFSVAKLYADFLDAFVIDSKDTDEKSRIEKLGIDVKVTDTVMKGLEDKVRLAKTVLEDSIFLYRRSRSLYTIWAVQIRQKAEGFGSPCREKSEETGYEPRNSMVLQPCLNMEKQEGI